MTSKEIEVNSLIALCEIENYDIFCKELEELISSNKNKNLIYKMHSIMQGKFVLGNKKYKDFVKKYQDVIQIMKKYDCLTYMTIVKYNPDGTPNKNSPEDYFYKFISEHKDDIETIKNIAIKLKNLGFDSIIYDEELEFTDTEYELSRLGFRFQYLENMEIIPTYYNEPIKYKSNGSCYCMTIGTYRYGKGEVVSNYDRKIILNSLMFDPDRLPNEITIESTVGYIDKLVEGNRKEYQIIRDSVNMSLSTVNLMSQYKRTKDILESIESVESKEQIKQILCDISRDINKLRLATLSLQKELIDGTEKISENIIEEEKKLCLHRYDY